MITMTHLYDTHQEAARVVAELKRSGIPDDDISLLGNNVDNQYLGDGTVDRDNDGADDRSEGAATGAGVGATVGGLGGLLAGLGIMAIPGIGPVVAAGWLASTALGAAVGGATGGVIGALTQAGVPDEEAHAYAEGVRRGGTLISVRVPETRREETARVLAGGSVDVRSRADDYRSSGWQRFEPSRPGLTAEELRRERERYSRL
jgi:uncharacterized membrane protein